MLTTAAKKSCLLTGLCVLWPPGVLDNKVPWPTESAGAVSNGGQLTADAPAHPEFPDGRMHDGVMLMLPSVPGLSAHPYKGSLECHKVADKHLQNESFFCLFVFLTLFSSTAGILKKKQLSPIVERSCPTNHVHSDPRGNVHGTASPHGSTSSDGRSGPARTSLPEQLNGVALSIKAGTVDGDSSGSE